MLRLCLDFFFFFQAEDGIRDLYVTGVQTCALPILRGSALMASQQPIARAAMGLEALGRGLREGRRQWDVATRQLATRAVDELKVFIRKVATWTSEDTAKAEALAAQLEQLGGRP